MPVAPSSRFRSLSSLELLPTAFPPTRPVHLGIGNYDGYHRGHRAVFAEAKRRAAEDGGIVGALTSVLIYRRGRALRAAEGE